MESEGEQPPKHGAMKTVRKSSELCRCKGMDRKNNKTCMPPARKRKSTVLQKPKNVERFLQGLRKEKKLLLIPIVKRRRFLPLIEEKTLTLDRPKEETEDGSFLGNLVENNQTQ